MTRLRGPRSCICVQLSLLSGCFLWFSSAGSKQWDLLPSHMAYHWLPHQLWGYVLTLSSWLFGGKGWTFLYSSNDRNARAAHQLSVECINGIQFLLFHGSSSHLWTHRKYSINMQMIKKKYTHTHTHIYVMTLESLYSNWKSMLLKKKHV